MLGLTVEKTLGFVLLLFEFARAHLHGLLETGLIERHLLENQIHRTHLHGTHLLQASLHVLARRTFEGVLHDTLLHQSRVRRWQRTEVFLVLVVDIVRHQGDRRPVAGLHDRLDIVVLRRSGIEQHADTGETTHAERFRSCGDLVEDDAERVDIDRRA